MRFYHECIKVANSVELLFTEEQRTLFIEADLIHLYEYQSSVGMWIQRRILPHNSYLHNALTVLGYTEFEDMSFFLLEFTQRYWKLKRADLM